MIVDFHRFMAELQKSEPQRDPKYGRFGLRWVFHVDQVPLPFAYNAKRTLNPKNASSCRIAAPNTSGLEKRQATLQLWICANTADGQPIRPAIIFRGTRGGRLPNRAEAAAYAHLTNIRIFYCTSAMHGPTKNSVSKICWMWPKTSWRPATEVERSCWLAWTATRHRRPFA